MVPRPWEDPPRSALKGVPMKSSIVEWFCRSGFRIGRRVRGLQSPKSKNIFSYVNSPFWLQEVPYGGFWCITRVQGRFFGAIGKTCTHGIASKYLLTWMPGSFKIH